MLGIAAEIKLAHACEERLGEIVHVAATFDLHQLSSPAGHLKPRKPEQMVIALTDADLWLLEYRYRVIGFTVGAPLCHLPRHGLVANWRRRRFTWPAVWRAEFSWPFMATNIEAALVSCNDTLRLMGLLDADEFDHQLGLAAPAPE